MLFAPSASHTLCCAPCVYRSQLGGQSVRLAVSLLHAQQHTAVPAQLGVIHVQQLHRWLGRRSHHLQQACQRQRQRQR